MTRIDRPGTRTEHTIRVVLDLTDNVDLLAPIVLPVRVSIVWGWPASWDEPDAGDEVEFVRVDADCGAFRPALEALEAAARAYVEANGDWFAERAREEGW